MQNQTKVLFHQYVQRIAELNGVTSEDVKEGFNVQPSIEQRLKEKTLLSSEFLQWINTPTVKQMEGELVGIGVGATIAGTTDTDTSARETTDIHQLDGRKFKCQPINFDTHTRWATIDAWAVHPDFQQKLASQTQQTIALNLIMMGFNGVRRATKSNKTENPLLQDVAVGWLQRIRNDASTKVMNGADTENKIKVGKNQEYKNLDALVLDVTNTLIDEVFADDTNLVVLCGRNLLSDKYFNIANKDLSAQDELASQVLISQKQVGGLRAIRVPYFPKNALLITRLDNLSIYMQEETTRRIIRNNPERSRIEDFLSQNIDYQVEDYRCVALVENIVLEDNE